MSMAGEEVKEERRGKERGGRGDGGNMISMLRSVHTNVPALQVGPANPSGHRQVAVDVPVP